MSLTQVTKIGTAKQALSKSHNAFISLPLRITSVESQERRKKRVTKSNIDGHRIAVKDNICTSNEPTTCASSLLDGFVSPYTATVVEKIQAAGAIVDGKTNLDEFGMGSHSTNTPYGAVSYGTTGMSVGGSSGGSAVAVASHQCFAALGTDTGGSIRLPAAYTGVVGFKPSYGVVSRRGVVAYANSMDTVGILARSAGHVKSVFDIIKGYDPADPTSLPRSSRSRIATEIRGFKRNISLRIGVPQEYNTDELGPEVRHSWEKTLITLMDLGHSILPISLPNTKLALSAYYILAPAEAASNLSKYDGVRFGKKWSRDEASANVLYANTRGTGFGNEVKRRILLGAYSLSARAVDNYFRQAQKIRRLVQQDFDRVFALQNFLRDYERPSAEQGVDCIITPTAPTLPPQLSSLEHNDTISTYSDDVLTVPASLAGLPAMSIPVCFRGAQYDRNIGIQLIAQYGDDELLFRLAQILEEYCATKRIDAEGFKTIQPHISAIET